MIVGIEKALQHQTKLLWITIFLVGFNKIISQPEFIEKAVSRLHHFFIRFLLSRQKPATFSMTVAVDVSARPNNSKVVVVSVENSHGGVEVKKI